MLQSAISLLLNTKPTKNNVLLTQINTSVNSKACPKTEIS